MPQLVKYGISVKEFWDMTPDEMNMISQAMAEKEKDQLAMNYNMATMIAQFVNCTLGGHDIPSIYEMFPYSFSEEEKEMLEQKKAELQFRQIAMAINRQRSTE